MRFTASNWYDDDGLVLQPRHNSHPRPKPNGRASLPTTPEKRTAPPSLHRKSASRDSITTTPPSSPPPAKSPGRKKARRGTISNKKKLERKSTDADIFDDPALWEEAAAKPVTESLDVSGAATAAAAVNLGQVLVEEQDTDEGHVSDFDFM
jgi:hypothetical protein